MTMKSLISATIALAYFTALMPSTSYARVIDPKGDLDEQIASLTINDFSSADQQEIKEIVEAEKWEGKNPKGKSCRQLYVAKIAKKLALRKDGQKQQSMEH